jgi:hypothetical protein
MKKVFQFLMFSFVAIGLLFTVESLPNVKDKSSLFVNQELDVFGCGPKGVGVIIESGCGQKWCAATRLPRGSFLDSPTHRTPNEDEIAVLRGMAQQDCNATSIQA